MSTVNVPNTPEEKAALINTLLEVAPSAAIELVSEKASAHDYDWIDAALQSSYLRTSIKAGRGEGCPFIYAGVPRFTALAEVLRHGLRGGRTHDVEDGPPVSEIDVREFGSRLSRWTDAFDAYYKEFASFDNPAPTATVLLGCAAAIGREDLIGRLAKMVPHHDRSSKINGVVIEALPDKVENVSAPGIALCFGQLGSLDALIAHGWDPTREVAYQRRDAPAKKTPIGLIEFCAEVANQPAIFADVVERVRTRRQGELHPDEVTYLAQLADECIRGERRLCAEYLEGLIKIGHFDHDDPQALIRKAIRNGCLPLLEHLKPHLVPSNIADEETRATCLHLAITEDSIPIVNRLEMVEMLCATGLPLDTLDSDGYPALHRAIHQHSESLVQLLLTTGASHRVQNSDGRDALEEAQEMNLGGERCAQLIQALRAQETVSSVIDRVRACKDNGMTP